ncbi:MAG: hypothetical protein AABX54_00800 [Nanoarchaeota archaeon]
MKLRDKIGAWIFLLGVVLAVISGIFTVSNSIVFALLVLVGILVGFLNVTGKESSKFLLAGAVLVIVSYMGQSAISAFSTITIGPLTIGTMITGILNALLILSVPAVIIVALKSIVNIAKN